MTVITIKKSSVEGKIPLAGDLAIAELAVNLKDRKLYTKDGDGNVIALGGEAQVPGGDTPPVVDNKPGDLFWDTATEQLLYWDGSQWLPIAGDEAIGITDLTDVTISGIADGQVLAYDSGSGEWLNVSPASLSVDVDLAYDAATKTVTNSAGDDAVLTVVDAVNAGLMEPADKAKLDALPAEGPVYVSSSQPATPSNGDIWVDLSECPPELKVWSDCSGTGQWEDIEGTPPLVVTQPVLSGTPQEGETLTCTEAVVVGGKPPVTSTYKFTDANDVVLQNTAARTYALSAGDLGKTIKCAVVATDSRGTVETSLDSNALGPVVPPSAVGAPTLITPANAATDVSASSIVMSCSAFSGTSVTYGQTVWQVSIASDFSSTVLDETNTDQTSYTAGFNPPLGYEATYYARCAHISSDGIQSAWSNVNEFETQENPIDPNIPSADMSGLRFDLGRLTKMSRTFSSVVSSFSVSLWIKPTAFNSTTEIVNIGDKDFTIELNSSGNLQTDLGGSSATGSGTVPLNTWAHVVFSYDSATLKGYLDGAEIISLDKSGVSFNRLEFDLGHIHTNTTNNFNGYMSEAYFAEEALPATVFGKTFPDGRWGPLDSSQIIENIGNVPVLSPYDTRANTDEVWSSGSTGSMASPWTNAFDGTTAFAEPLPSQSGQVTFTPAIPFSSLELLAAKAPSVGNAIVVNGVSITVTATSSGLMVWDDITSAGIGSSLSTIQLNQNGSLGGILAGIRVNGRILVDQGVWNQSQNWSEGATTNDPSGFLSNAQPSLAFDGNTDTYCDAASTGKTITVTFPGGLDYTSKVEVFIRQKNVNAGINGGAQVQVSGDPIAFVWAEVVTGSGTMNSLEVTGTTNYCGLAGVRVDGSILVDAGAQWNTSQLWSGDGTITGEGYSGGGGDPRRMFDGDLTTSQYSKNTGTERTTFNFKSDITVSNSLRFYAAANPNGSPGNNDGFWVNGNNYSNLLDTKAQWVTIPETNLSYFELRNIGGAYNSAVAAIEVDGEILVDKASFGANGFYLPFDPTNTGANYSDSLVATLGSFASDRPPALALDGSLTTSARIDPSGAGSMSFAPSSAINFSQKIEAMTTAADNIIAWDGNEASGNIEEWFTIYSGSGEISASKPLTVTATSLNATLVAVRVDGVLLVDHNSIGVDASGNENNFLDQNFGVGNTSKVWSNEIVGTTVNSWSYIFDGSTRTGARASNGTSATFTNTFTEDVTSLRLYVYGAAYEAAQHEGLTVNGVVQSGMPGKDWFAPSVSYPFRDLVITIASGSNSTITGLSAIEVNGVHLVDPSYLDTVTDTPLMNYAVLESGSNGNLTFDQTASAWAREGSTVSARGKKVYAETIVQKITAADRVSFGLFVDASSGNEIGKQATDYGYIGNGQKKNSNTAESYGASYTVGDIIGVTYDSASGAIEFFKNGTSQGVAYTGIPADQDYIIGLGLLASECSINFGQQPFVASNVTYDQATGIATVGGVDYNTLFQTWDEWATFGLFFFNENTGKTITSFDLNRKYGLTAAAPDAGIYNLTFQPRATVLEYLKQATAYLPLEDLFPELEATQAKLSNTEESLTATQTELVQVRAERDEAKDNLEEQIAKLAARIALLEAPKKGTKK